MCAARAGGSAAGARAMLYVSARLVAQLAIVALAGAGEDTADSTCASLQTRLDHVTAACCGQSGSKCNRGKLSTCSHACARSVFKVEGDCKPLLRSSHLAEVLRPVLSMCKQQQPQASALTPAPPPSSVSSWPTAYVVSAGIDGSKLKEDGDHYNALGRYNRTTAM